MDFSQPAGTELAPEITLGYENGEDTLRLSKKFRFGNGTKNSTLEKRNQDGSWRQINEGESAEDQMLKLFDEKLRLKGKAQTQMKNYVEGNDMPFSGLFRVFYQQQRDLGSMVQKSNAGKNEDEISLAFSNSISNVKGVSVLPSSINTINAAMITNLKSDLTDTLVT